MTSSLTTQQMSDAKASALQSFLNAHKPKAAKKKGGEPDPIRITTLADSTYLDVDAIPTGSLSLDHALGIGGFPKGRISELYGPTGGGKTTLALEAAKNCQDAGGVVGFVDAEQALNRELVDQIGIDPARFVLAQTETGEQAAEVCESMIRSGAFDMVIIDSAAALIPAAEMESSFEQQHMGLQARLLSKLMRKLTGPVSQFDVALVVINQVRSNLAAYGAPEESTGGKALKFFSSVRVEVRTSASKQIKEGTNVVGTMVTATVKKNKFAAPFKKCDYTITFGMGIDASADVFNVGVDLGVLERAGNTYYLRVKGEALEKVEMKLGVGAAKAQEFLNADEELFAEVESAVRATLAGKSAVNAIEPAEEGAVPAGAPATEAPAQAQTRPPVAQAPAATDDDFFGLND